MQSETEILQLTKAQVAGIVTGELKKNYFWLQCFLLTIIGLIIANLIPSERTPIITLLIGVNQLCVLYFMYNSVRNKLSDLKKKHGAN